MRKGDNRSGQQRQAHQYGGAGRPRPGQAEQHRQPGHADEQQRSRTAQKEAQLGPQPRPMGSWSAVHQLVHAQHVLQAMPAHKVDSTREYRR